MERAFPVRMGRQSVGHGIVRTCNGKTSQGADFKRLQSIFEGDGSDIRRQFILAGLLLTIFERCKEYVVNQVDEFFAHRFEIRTAT